MSDGPKLSVIIPVFNGEDHIETAIGSCLAQIPDNQVEVIVVDDGSTDSTAKILGRYKGRNNVRVLTQENSGPAAARNTGIASSQSELISFLDADDYYGRNTIGAYLHFAGSAPSDTALFYSSFYKFTDPQLLVPVAVNPPLKRPFLFHQFLVPRAYPILTSTVMVRRSAIEKVGVFDATYQRCEDLHMWSRIVESFAMARLPLFATFRRQHDGQVTQGRQQILYWRERANISFLQRNPFSSFSGQTTNTEMAKLAREFALRFLQSAEPLPFCADHCFNIARGLDPAIVSEEELSSARNMMSNWPYRVEVGG